MTSKKKKGSKKKQKFSAKKRQTTSVAAKDTELDTTLISQLHPITDGEIYGKGHRCYLGDCLICMLALPPDESQSVYVPCCMKSICIGCSLASDLTDQKARRDKLCPFCREPILEEGPEELTLVQKRVDAGDADAHYELGQWYDSGERGLLTNRKRAIVLWEEAQPNLDLFKHITIWDVRMMMEMELKGIRQRLCTTTKLPRLEGISGHGIILGSLKTRRETWREH